MAHSTRQGDVKLEQEYPNIQMAALNRPSARGLAQNLNDVGAFYWRNDIPQRLYVRVENRGTEDVTVQTLVSLDNARTRPYQVVALSQDGAAVDDVTVHAGAASAFEVPIPATQDIGASGFIRIADNILPADGDTLTLEDASGTSEVFEFSIDSSISPGSDRVVRIDNRTEKEVISEIRRALDEESALNIESYVNPDEPRVLDMYQRATGQSGNTAIQFSGDSSVFEIGHLDGGSDAPSYGSSQIPPYVMFRAQAPNAAQMYGSVRAAYFHGELEKIVPVYDYLV